jgi:hypothetical protein
LLGYEDEEFERGDGGEAFPVRLPGVKKILSTKTIGTYYTPDLFHYLSFYQKTKKCGFPFGSWLEAPAWTVQILLAFNYATEEVKNDNERKEMAKWRKHH